MRLVLREMARRLRFWLRLGLTIQAAALVTFSLLVTPDQIERGEVTLSQPCPALVASGDKCPTCGVTRGLAAMGSLEWPRAWEYNPISVGLFLAELLLLIGLLRPAYRRRWPAIAGGATHAPQASSISSSRSRTSVSHS